jgi:peptidoglycan/xylan/chitin deacetylase (PgdA/CDA1 family)
VHLTFDDGPSALTAPLLDLLARHRVTATFFVLGARARRAPMLVRRAHAEGHEIGCHGWVHLRLPTFARALIECELAAGHAAIAELTGVAPRTFRPPYGAADERVRAAAAALGMRMLLWDVDGEDHRAGASAEQIAARLAAARADDVVLLHDGRRAGRRTLAALELALA